MNKPNIVKVDVGKFQIIWENNTKLDLNFKPLLEIERFKDLKSICFLHYQSMPKGLRDFGVYCKKSDNYYCCGQEIVLTVAGIPVTIIEESSPNAVIAFPKCLIKQMPNSPLYLTEDYFYGRADFGN